MATSENKAAKAKAVSHGLGVGHGSLIEHPDGSVEYRQTGKLLPAFRVRTEDIAGFTVRKVTRDDKKRLGASGLQQVLVVQGLGTLLAEAAVNYNTAEKIQAWFKQQPNLGANTRGSTTGAAPAAAPVSVADELVKLAALRDQGVLTDDEFQDQKRRLLG